MKRLELAGKKFGRWEVLEFAGLAKGYRTLWRCRCACGTEKIIQGHSLVHGGTYSCGCTTREAVSQANTTHGESRGRKRTASIRMFWGARERAVKNRILFALRPEDIVIPDVCPLLGIPLIYGNGKGGHTNNSPSLDRKRPVLGYVRENVWVISYRANAIKRDASLAELEMLVERLRANV